MLFLDQCHRNASFSSLNNKHDNLNLKVEYTPILKVYLFMTASFTFKMKSCVDFDEVIPFYYYL